MEKSKILDDSKHIKIDEFKESFAKMLKSDSFDKISEQCPELREAMDCDKARSFQKCVMMV